MQINTIAKAKYRATAGLPSFVIENHEAFVEFLKSYFLWSASRGNELILESLKNANDIDTTIDDLLPSYRNAIAKAFPDNTKSDFRHFSKFLKNFYGIKGTEESFRLFFNIIFGENATVKNPKDRMLIPSNGTVYKEYSILVNSVSGNAFDLLNKEVIGDSSGSTAEVSNIVKLTDGTFKLTLDYVVGEFSLTDNIVSGSIKCAIVPQYKLLSFVSENSYHDGDLINIDGLLLVVNRIEYGNIESVNITNGGTGYKKNDRLYASTSGTGSGFIAFVNTVDSNGAIQSINIVRSGFAFDKNDVVLSVRSESGNGAVLVPVMNQEFMKIKKLSIANNKKYPYGNDGHSVTLQDGTIINFGPIAHSELLTSYSNRSSPSSTTANLHDSYYFQNFSYEIVSRANTKNFTNDIKNLMHIAGMKMFIKNTYENSYKSNKNFSVVIS